MVTGGSEAHWPNCWIVPLGSKVSTAQQPLCVPVKISRSNFSYQPAASYSQEARNVGGCL